jgi:hypothetical protein
VGISGIGVEGTVGMLVESILGALASGMLMWDWLGEGTEGAMGETGLYGRGGLRAIFRTAGTALSCPFPSPSFDN